MRVLRDQAGFSLIELLVVMLILGLLAAIAIPSFFEQRHKGQDAAAKSAIRAAELAIATYATDNEGSYGGATVAGLEDIEPTLGDATLAIDWATDDTFRVTVTSTTGNAFSIDRDASGARTLSCDPPGNAGCPPGGTWG